MEQPEESASVFLGYLSDPVVASEDTRDIYNPKIGGRPAWVRDPVKVPPCSKCGAPLRLLVQTFDPVEEIASLERVIYLFVCNKTDCSNSIGWFAVRAQSVSAEAAESASVAAVTELVKPAFSPVAVFTSTKPATSNLFSGGWDEEPTNDAPAYTPNIDDLLRKRGETKSTPAPAAPPAAQPVEAATEYETPTGPDIFAAYYLDVQPEPAAPKHQKELKVVESLLPEEPGETWAEEGYEESSNKTLIKFQRRLERSPEQVIRYSYKGKPRWISDAPVIVPPCSACGAQRVFEFQVMPPLVYFLECAPDELDFGTAAVFVCGKNCGVGNFVEHVVAQAW